MGIKTGIDLVYLPRFKKALKNGGEKFLRRIFNEEELPHLRGESSPHLGGEIEHLASVFAAKEAVMKALSMPVDLWHDIQITHKRNGAPSVRIMNYELRIKDCSLSISHDGNYVIAYFVALISADPSAGEIGR